MNAEKQKIADELIAKAKALMPIIAERAQEAEDNGQIHDETVAAMKEAGLFRVLQSANYGGFELDPDVFYEIQAIIAQGDMSAAWIYGVIGVHPWQLALFEKQMQDDVYGPNGENKDVLVASSYMPTGVGTPVEGGYKFSGTWGFSSGSKHCDWIIVGGVVPKPEDAPPGPPDMRNFVVHKDDYEIVQNWDVLGLKGTGSNDVVVKDVFVPEHRVFKVGVPAGGQPGNQVNTAPLFNVEFGQIFPRAVAYSAVGALQAVVEEAKVFASAVSPNTGMARGDLPEVQVALSNAVNEIEVQKLIMKATVAEWMEHANKGEPLPLERRSYRRYQQAQIIDKCLSAALELYKQLGGNAARRGVITKAISDMETGRCHVANMSFKQGQNYGSVATGRKQVEFFL